MKKTRGAFMVCSWDTQWGGFYLHRGETSTRICLGYFAITLVREPLDDIVKDAMLHRSRLHRLEAGGRGQRAAGQAERDRGPAEKFNVELTLKAFQSQWD